MLAQAVYRLLSSHEWQHAGSKETNYEKSASPQLKEAIEDRFGSLNKLKQACMPGFQLPQGQLVTARCNLTISGQSPGHRHLAWL